MSVMSIQLKLDKMVPRLPLDLQQKLKEEFNTMITDHYLNTIVAYNKESQRKLTEKLEGLYTKYEPHMLPVKASSPLAKASF